MVDNRYHQHTLREFEIFIEVAVEHWRELVDVKIVNDRLPFQVGNFSHSSNVYLHRY
jgi:hypothetical protein